MPLFSISETKSYLLNLGKALMPGLNWSSSKSSPARRAAYLAGAVTQVESAVDTARTELHPKTAPDGKPINDWGDVLQIPRKAATPARGTAAGRVRGTVGAAILAGAQLKDDTTGMFFAIGINGAIPAGGFTDLDIVGLDTGDPTTAGTGAKSRLTAGTVLKLIAPPVGIQQTVTLVKDLGQDGSDNEPYGSYAPRIWAAFGTSTRSGGSQSDFVQWTLASLPQVVQAFAYPNRAGRGTLDVVGFTAAAGAARALTLAERDAVLAYITTQTNAPFQITGTGGALRVLLTVPDPQRVEIRLAAEATDPFRFQWSDGLAPTVASFNAGTNELQFLGGALPTSLRAGHSLILDGVGGGSGVNSQDGAPIQIQSISAVDKVILARAPTVPPASPDKIYASGPLVIPVRDAIVEHLNGGIVYAGKGRTLIPGSKAAPTLPGGPSVQGVDALADGIGSANPGGLYGAWPGGISVTTLTAIARYQLGVRGVTVVTPAVDYESLDDPFPNDAQIHYVTPLTVIVRSA